MHEADSRERTEETEDDTPDQLGDSTEATEEPRDDATFRRGDQARPTPLTLATLRREATMHLNDTASRAPPMAKSSPRAKAIQARLHGYQLRQDAYRAWRNSLRGAGTPDQYSDLMRKVMAANRAEYALDKAANAMARELHHAETAALAEGKASSQPRSVRGRSA